MVTKLLGFSILAFFIWWGNTWLFNHFDTRIAIFSTVLTVYLFIYSLIKTFKK
jgi:low temperature requirement protein LtrA